MKKFSEFDIQLYKLPEKTHYFDFKVGSSFFYAFEDNTIADKGEFDIHLKLTKKSSFIELEFSIDGWIELECDRSLRLFRYPLSAKKMIILKYGEEEAEISEDVLIIERDTISINVAQFIFEFILLEIPAKKIHPDMDQDEDFVYKSTNEEQKEEKTDPRWEVLKKLK